MHFVFIFGVGKIIFWVLIGRKKKSPPKYSSQLLKKEKQPQNVDLFEGMEYFFQHFL